MKLEALQSLSVIVMFAGLFLSALGGFGAYFFSGGSERAGRAPAFAQVESVEPELPARDSAEEARLAAIVEPVAEVSAKQFSPTPEPALPPIREKPPAAPEPAPVLAKTTAPEKPKTPTAPAATPPEAKKTALPAPAPVIAKTAIPEKKVELPPPVAEKLPEPAPAKPAPTTVLAKAAAPENQPPAAAHSTRLPQLGIEPWQKEKLLQRLRTFQNGAIAIQVPQGNDEAMGFATALKEAFLAAGWHVTGLTSVKTDREIPGLTLSSGTFPPPTEVTTVFSALVSAGIKLSTELDPAQGKKPPTLFVGSRP